MASESLAVSIFFGAWTASVNVEARLDTSVLTSTSPSAKTTHEKLSRVIDTDKKLPANNNQQVIKVEEPLWERTALLICPLH